MSAAPAPVSAAARSSGALVSTGVSAGLVVMWSSGFIGAELGTRETGADTLLMWRFLVAGALLGGAWLLLRRRRLPARALAEQSAIGLLSQGVYLGSIVWAVGLGVPSGTSALIAALQPLAAGALAGRLLGEQVSRRQWAGLLTGLGGVALVVRDDLAAQGAAPPWAYALPFAGMAGLLAASFLERRAHHPLPAADALPLHCVVSALVFSAVAGALGHAAPPASSGGFWLAVAWVLVLSTVGGYGFYWMSLRRDGVTRTSALIYLTPPTTVLWAYFMFGDAPGVGAALGMLVCVGGVVAATVRPRAGTGTRAARAETQATGTGTSAKEPQSVAGRYPRHDGNDSRLQSSADRAARGGGCDRTHQARHLGPAAGPRGQGAFGRRFRLLQPAERARSDPQHRCR
ncbi:DMT family transporter [Streptomyces sp. NBC_01186]|uniref:DMT family transporter n=1 Tax=Streptomyces sp. NBC_01186 TaxID=2903765 RepID=UPI002E146AAD|nr:DMT family transporter [Streptomyces sp. NBC_01186]